MGVVVVRVHAVGVHGGLRCEVQTAGWVAVVVGEMKKKVVVWVPHKNLCGVCVCGGKVCCGKTIYNVGVGGRRGVGWVSRLFRVGKLGGGGA